MGGKKQKIAISVLWGVCILIGCSDGTKTAATGKATQNTADTDSAPNSDSPGGSTPILDAVEPDSQADASIEKSPTNSRHEMPQRNLPQPLGDPIDRSEPKVADQDRADQDQVNMDEQASDEPPSPEDIARAAFTVPPGARSMTKEGGLWVDRDRKRVYVDGYVAITRGALEMLACPIGTKEHESIVATLAKSSEVHAALLAVGAQQGTPVRFRPEFLPPTGQVIRVWVTWRDKDGKFRAVDAREWIQDYETEKAMSAEFVFAGSDFWKDPADGKEYYRADAGDMICVSNFVSAMIDVSINSSADADSLQYIPFEEKIPPRYTPVRLVLVPVPQPTDAPRDEQQEAKQLAKPEEEVLTLAQKTRG